MGLADDTMAKLTERHAAERALVRDVGRRYERAVASAAKAREVFEAAEAERAAVLGEWTAAPGWTAERVAEFVGLTAREVSEAARRESTAVAGRRAQLDPAAASAAADSAHETSMSAATSAPALSGPDARGRRWRAAG
jgi:hypothetical protein